MAKLSCNCESGTESKKECGPDWVSCRKGGASKGGRVEEVSGAAGTLTGEFGGTVWRCP
jgi:hypothetical protein